MAAFLALAKLRNIDLNSFLTSNTDLNAFCPFQHRGRVGSDTCLSDLLRPPLSCKARVSKVQCLFLDKNHGNQNKSWLKHTAETTAWYG
jgi:hypothetical protein